MDFDFTPEQVMLRDTVAAYLADNYSFEQRRKFAGKEPGWRREVWQAFAEELGILGAPFSEELGGLGGGPIENMIVMEELGAALVVEPYLGTVVIGGGFLKNSKHSVPDLIEGVIGGKTIFAFAYAEPSGRYNLASIATQARKKGAGWVLNGRKAVVIGAPFATHLIVTARTAGAERDAKGVSVFVLKRDAPGVTMRDFPTVDGFRAAEIYFEGVELSADALIGEVDEGLPLIEQVVDEAIAATCGEACGVLRQLHLRTLEYTRQRKQFGATLSSFQALQHRMADMFVQLEQAVSMTYMANLKVHDSAERAKAVSAAKVQIGRASRFIGPNAIQLHGGMGMTDEMAVGHYFKRATMIESAFGSVDHHLARYEALSDHDESRRDEV